MELTNRTRFPAHLFRGYLGGDTLMGSLAVRITYDLSDGDLVPADDQPWLLHAAPWDSPYGPLPGDELFYRSGTDVFVFGSCRPMVPVSRFEVSVEIEPDFRCAVAVFGRRVWRREGTGFVKSEPERFSELALTLANAFGGEDEWDGLQLTYGANAVGKGYSHSDEHTEGRELPNIEDPEHLIERWDDQPVPVGVCPAPVFFPLRAEGAVEFDPATGRLLRVNPRLYNAAFPAMMAPPVNPGSVVRVHGVTGGGPLEFRLPEEGPRIRLTFEEMVTEGALKVDQIGVEVDAGRVFLSYRYPFKYVLVPLQRRTCELLWPDDSQAGCGPGLAESLEPPLPQGRLSPGSEV